MIKINEFLLDMERFQLIRDDQVIHCEPLVLELIAFMATNPDRLLTKDALIDAVWSGRIVSDATVSGCVAAARRALGDTGQDQKYIKTLHGRGYRFVGANLHDPPKTTWAQPAGVSIEINERPTGVPVIAVISFSLIGTNEGHEAIAEAIPTELISALSRFRAFKVIARGSAFQFNSMRIDHREIRKRLGATYVVSGAVELSNSVVRVTIELTDTEHEHVVWSDTFSASLDEVFALREGIARAVAVAVETQVPFHEAKRQAGVPTEHMDAWGHYHLGISHLYRFNANDNSIAMGHFRKAIESDQSFARAFAGLSYTEFAKYNLWGGADRTVHLVQALAMAERSIELDPYDPFCNLVLGRAKWIDLKLHEAISWVDRSIELNPNYSFAIFNSGKLRAIACEGEDAEILARAAIELSPIDPHLQTMFCIRAMAGFVRGDRESAVKYSVKSLSAPRPHLFVCLWSAIIFSIYGEDAHLARAMKMVRQAGTDYSRDYFLALFDLQDPARRRDFHLAFDKLGL